MILFFDERKMDHYIERCKNCQKLISQCKCLEPKEVIWPMCEDCKAAQKNGKTPETESTNKTKCENCDDFKFVGNNYCRDCGRKL